MSDSKSEVERPVFSDLSVGVDVGFLAVEWTVPVHGNPTNWGVPRPAQQGRPLILQHRPAQAVKFNYGGHIGKLYVTYENSGDAGLVEKFMHRLQAECVRKGVSIDEARSQLVNLAEEVAGRQNVFEKISAETDNDDNPPVVLYIDRYTQSAHGRIKVLDVLHELRTQHINADTVEKVFAGDQMIMDNIVRTLNIKSGEVIHDLNSEKFPSATWLSEYTMVLGISVAHPSLKSESGIEHSGAHFGNIPSIVGFSANCYTIADAYASDFHFQQAQQELVSLPVLVKRMRWLLQMYEENRGHLPEHIFVLREGLAARHFPQLRAVELPDLVRACNEYKDGYNPKIVAVAVTEGSYRNNKYYGIMQKYDQSITPQQISSFITDLHFNHPVAQYTVCVPKALYEAYDWTRKGETIFTAFRENGFVLPLSSGPGAQSKPELACGDTGATGCVDWEKVTSKLCYMGKKHAGLRVKN